MKILFTGNDDFKYNRTRILLNGLLESPEVEVIQYPLNKEGFSKAEFQKQAEEADYIYIGAMRHSDVRPVRKMTSTPIVFDPLISKYLTRTIDHGKWWTAPEKYYRDWVAFRNCDVIMMDTQGDIDWIVNKYNLDPANIFVLPIGVDTSIFKPAPGESNEKFTVGFHGGFIPLQGLDKIVETARVLQKETDIHFDIVGAGSQYKKIRKLADGYQLENMQFRGWVNYDDINPIINAFDVCLGIFADSIKTDLVIPNKVYEYAALGKCIITKDTPAIKEVFTDGKDIQLTQATPENMAEAILAMKEDQEKRTNIGKAAYELIVNGYDPLNIGKKFVKNMEQWESSKTSDS